MSDQKSKNADLPIWLLLYPEARVFNIRVIYRNVLNKDQTKNMSFEKSLVVGFEFFQDYSIASALVRGFMQYWSNKKKCIRQRLKPGPRA